MCTCSVFLASGITFGVFAVNHVEPDKIKEINEHFDFFIQQIPSLQIDNVQAVQLSIWRNIITIFVIYIFGLTIIGIPVVLALLFVRGFALGFTLIENIKYY